MEPLGVAVVGCGYWGPNLVRNFDSGSGTRVRWAVDLDQARLREIGAGHPRVRLTSDLEEVLKDPETAIVSVATPVETHHRIAKAALEAGKHVLVEKPITANVAHAEELVALARRKGLVLACDHTFVFTGAVRKIKELVSSGKLGQILYFDSVRANLGVFQRDVNVIWDLAPHDLSILDHLVGRLPKAVIAVGACHAGQNLENIAYLTLIFEGQLIAHIHVNWLAPIKIRQILIGGSEKMVVYDDMEISEKVKIYDKGISVSANEMLVGYRTGDMLAPQLDRTEALRLVADHFVECIRERKTPINDGESALRVLKVLEAARVSIREGGRRVEV
jgi:predicted dehydrogenase